MRERSSPAVPGPSGPGVRPKPPLAGRQPLPDFLTFEVPRRAATTAAFRVGTRTA